VTIQGANFKTGAAVKIGGVAATSVTIVSATKITAKTPLLSAGKLNDVNVVNPGNAQGTLAKGFFADFTDVPGSDLFHADVESIFRTSVTAGCSDGTIYCVDSVVTRAQMAVFLLKAEHGSAYVPPACAANPTVFADVVCPSLYADWIEQLAAEGVTAGCGGANYCPDASVTRKQMAVFLLKTEHGSAYVPPGCAANPTSFGDVACPSQYADWIEQLAAEGITAGCGGGNYCPNLAVLRGPMATFLTKTFGLSPAIPVPVVSPSPGRPEPHKFQSPGEDP